MPIAYHILPRVPRRPTTTGSSMARTRVMYHALTLKLLDGEAWLLRPARDGLVSFFERSRFLETAMLRRRSHFQRELRAVQEHSVGIQHVASQENV